MTAARWESIRGSITHEVDEGQAYAVITLQASLKSRQEPVGLIVRVPQEMWQSNARRHLDWAARDLASRGVIL